METSRLKIQVRELPLRSLHLSAEQLSSVVGGCIGERVICEWGSDCCDGLECTYNERQQANYCRRKA